MSKKQSTSEPANVEKPTPPSGPGPLNESRGSYVPSPVAKSPPPPPAKPEVTIEEGKEKKGGVNSKPTTAPPTPPLGLGEVLSTEEKYKKEKDNTENDLKLEALKAAIQSGFLSGFTSAANQISVRMVGKPLTPTEVQFYSNMASKGAEWYIPLLLESAEGQAIADILGVKTPYATEDEEEETKPEKPTPPPTELREESDLQRKPEKPTPPPIEVREEAEIKRKPLVKE